MQPPDHDLRMQRASLSLDGLSLGEAFGQGFFDNAVLLTALVMPRTLPAAPWTCTDDTEMALAIVEVLDDHGGIDQDRLAQVFARRQGPSSAQGLLGRPGGERALVCIVEKN